MTIVVSGWQVLLYLLCVFGTLCFVAWTAYDLGRTAGKRMERIRSRASLDEATRPVPRAFVQRNPQHEGRRIARNGKSRVIPRRQITPGPRREKPKEQQ